MNQDDKPTAPVEPEEFDVNSLANALLGKDKEEEKPDEKPEDEGDKPDEDDKPEGDKPDESDKPADKPEDKPADGDKPADDKVEGESTEEAKPLSRDDIKAALREEQEERERTSSERNSFAGKVRDDLKEALKLDDEFTQIKLDDGTPISSVTQLTQVINPETDEPYTREEATSLLLDAQRIVQENIAAQEKRVDELTDVNVSFKEEADRVDELYGDILKAFPDTAKELLAAYQKTFKTSEDGSYVTEVPISPLEFYGPALKPFRNATDQVLLKQQEEARAAEKVAKQAEIKADQEDRGDLGSTAGDAKGKPNILATALDKYLEQ